MRVRSAVPGDLEGIVALRCSLWPEGSPEEHREEVADTLAGRPRSALPAATFIAEQGADLIGFVDVGLRSHADGCDPARPCGFLEGWYVAPGHRRSGVGRALIDRAEAWARDQGCTEMASDTWLDSEDSQHAHAALGYEVVDRCVHFRKLLRGGDGR